MSDAQANDAQVYSWEDICPSAPISPSAATSSASQSSYAPSSFISSPSGTTSTLASSPSPSGGNTTSSLTDPHHEVASNIDYMAVHDHIPALYAAYQDAPDAMQVLQAIIDLVVNGVQPGNSLINDLIVHDEREYRCSMNACPRHSQGSGWSRLDRAREHFRNEHLGSYFPCSFPGCGSRYRRRSDLKAHVVSHGDQAPKFGCSYCHKSYSRRCNLHRHIEVVHRKHAPRRVRRNARL